MLKDVVSRLRTGKRAWVSSQKQPRDKEDQRPVTNAVSLGQGWRGSVGYQWHQHTHPEEVTGMA